MANTPIYFTNGGANLVVGAGGTIDATAGTINVGTIDLGANAVATVNIQDGAVTTSKIANAAVDFDKILVYVSESQTGTGMQQSIPHGLGVIPQFVLFMPIDTSGTMTPGDFTITPGVHTINDILVTATSGLVYQILAWG